MLLAAFDGGDGNDETCPRSTVLPRTRVFVIFPAWLGTGAATGPENTSSRDKLCVELRLLRALGGGGGGGGGALEDVVAGRGRPTLPPVGALEEVA